MEYNKSFAAGTISLVLFGIVMVFGYQVVLSQPDHFEDAEQNRVNSADLFYRKGNSDTWHLGKGLGPGSLFTYKVCDMILTIPESPGHCYHISLEFIDILKGPRGDVWIVQAIIDHQDKRTYSIFQISAVTFDITTDGASIPYADSVSRTIFWIGKFTNELGQKPLAVGKSWGKVETHTAPKTELVIRNTEIINLNKEQQLHTFVLGYNLIELSTVNINEDFPFPIKATIYKPTISHQNIPLQFTIELVDYTTDNFLDRFPTQTVPSQNESLGQMKDFEDDVMLNEKSTGEDTEMDFIFDELNATSLEEDNSNSTGINYLDAINLEKLFEMFLKEHFEDDDSDDQIIDLTVFLDFLNKTDSAIIGNQNSTGP